MIKHRKKGKKYRNRIGIKVQDKVIIENIGIFHIKVFRWATRILKGTLGAKKNLLS